MIAFTSLLWIWRNGGAGSWYFVTVPEEQAGEIRAHAFGSPRGFGSVRVEPTISDVTWRTSVFPQKSGGYLMPVKVAVRKQANLVVDAPVDVTIQLIDG